MFSALTAVCATEWCTVKIQVSSRHHKKAGIPADTHIHSLIHTVRVCECLAQSALFIVVGNTERPEELWIFFVTILAQWQMVVVVGTRGDLKCASTHVTHSCRPYACPPNAPQANLRCTEHQDPDRTCSVFSLLLFSSCSCHPSIPALI